MRPPAAVVSTRLGAVGHRRDRDRVRAPLRAEALRLRELRLLALVRACRESALGEAAPRPSRFSAPRTARDRFEDLGRPRPERPRAESRAALRLVSRDVVPAFGGRSFTPARRALDSPIAIACFDERAPCLP
jgi:hypothetical protein